MTEWKPAKGWLQDKAIPRNAQGDPAFQELGCDCGNCEMSTLEGTMLSVFTPEQIVYLVNKALYALDYQREHHRKRAQEEQEVLGPIKKEVKRLFGVSYLKATEAQIDQAIENLKEKKGEQKG